jgi:CRISPR/Cas system-associated protein endoribonuclease Cas2
VQDEAVALFSKALEKEGLSMQQYSVLFHTVNADDALRERVLRLIEEERAKS